MSFRFIEDHRNMYPVRLMCEVLEVSPAGYYAWRTRPVSERTQANATLLAEVRQVYQNSGGRYGSPRIHAALTSQGRGTSRGRIERMMQRHGIRAIMAPPRRVRTTDSRHDLPIAPNLIMRDFTAPAPNRVWLADITYSAPRPTVGEAYDWNAKEKGGLKKSDLFPAVRGHEPKRR
ncbi:MULTISPECIES: IS3 family transposase [Bradyrhizobium]|uniref:IS3 family transposase n=1 Tax=Bradyrhizobium TaxID=374 RepID=UPI002714D2B8|nr:IS3 family transposase [Bradyrhizobium elkanii]WLA46702.1 IS3 family transposase [Bradyrhizobium elkanii]WLB83006.1 IS3 family transposase [Bradyrhizobium elkanii]